MGKSNVEVAEWSSPCWLDIRERLKSALDRKAFGEVMGCIQEVKLLTNNLEAKLGAISFLTYFGVYRKGELETVHELRKKAKLVLVRSFSNFASLLPGSMGTVSPFARKINGKLIAFYGHPSAPDDLTESDLQTVGYFAMKAWLEMHCDHAADLYRMMINFGQFDPLISNVESGAIPILYEYLAGHVSVTEPELEVETGFIIPTSKVNSDRIVYMCSHALWPVGTGANPKLVKAARCLMELFAHCMAGRAR